MKEYPSRKFYQTNWQIRTSSNRTFKVQYANVFYTSEILVLWKKKLDKKEFRVVMKHNFLVKKYF